MARSKERLPPTYYRLFDVQRGEQRIEWSIAQKARLIVPEKLRNRVLKTIYEGHFGFKKTQLRAQEAVFGSRCI